MLHSFISGYWFSTQWLSMRNYNHDLISLIGDTVNENLLPPQLLKSNGCKERVDRSTIAWGADFHTLRTADKAHSSLGTVGSPPMVRVDGHAFARWADFLTKRTCLRAYNAIRTFWGPPKLGVKGLTLAWSAQLLTRWTELVTHWLVGLDTVVRPVVILQYMITNVYCWGRQRCRSPRGSPWKVLANVQEHSSSRSSLRNFCRDFSGSAPRLFWIHDRTENSFYRNSHHLL